MYVAPMQGRTGGAGLASTVSMDLKRRVGLNMHS